MVIKKRVSIRLVNYDYSQKGLYFITICTKNRERFFGEIKDGKMFFSEIGKIANDCWNDIPQHFSQAFLHEFVVMPDHIHGIIEINNPPAVGANHYSPEMNHYSPQINNYSYDNQYLIKNHTINNVAKHTIDNRTNDVSTIRAKDVSPLRGTSQTIGSIVRGFKIGVTKQIGFSPWQRNYYEHVIRSEIDYLNIANYIIENPLKWNNYISPNLFSSKR